MLYLSETAALPVGWARSHPRATRAFESFARLFKGGRVQGRRPWPPASAGGTPLCSKKRRRGSKGEPSPGVPPFYVCACAPLRWAADRGDSASPPHFFARAQRNGVEPQRNALFGGGLYRIRDVRCVSHPVSNCPARRITASLTFAGGERAHPVLRCRRKDTANAACDPLS